MDAPCSSAALRTGHGGRIAFDGIGKTDYNHWESARGGRGYDEMENLGCARRERVK